MRQNVSVFFSLLVFPVSAFATDYMIDQGHSSVNFKIRHLVSKTIGKFDRFKGVIAHEAGKPDTWKVDAQIEAASINTNEPKRDKHLRSADFFDTDKFKVLTFKSTGVKDGDEKSAKVEGNLTIHGVTKPVVLNVEMGGEGTDPWGNKKIGFTATTKINRKDFGLSWNKALETGSFLVGEEVDIVLEIEADAAKVPVVPVVDVKKAKK